MNGELLLIDLSSIAHPMWHMNQSDPDMNATATKTVARVRVLAANHPKAAICCDCGKSFRHEITPTYKANRPERDAVLHHQIDLAREQLIADGFPVWAVRGFEADDVIATATTKALEADLDVLIVSADKDLLQLVGPRVRAMSANNGTLYDAEAVRQKFGIGPEQVRDYLTLVGDVSDNIKGAKGIGDKKAAELLVAYQTLDGVYAALKLHPSKFKPAMATALKDFEPAVDFTRELVTLRTDVEIPFDDITRERVPAEAATFMTEDEMDELADERCATDDGTRPREFAPSVKCDGNHAMPRCADPGCWQDQPASTGLAKREAVEILPAPAEWERGLDPRSMKEARLIAKDLYDSRMFSAYGTPQAVLSTIMVGRELGLPAMASLRCIYNLEGKHALSASLMAALVLKSGFAEYFEPVEFTDTQATFETHRKGARNPVRLTHTFEMARTAWPKSKADWEKGFLASGWGKNPTDMLVARCQSRLARLVYPDLLANLYTPDELKEARESFEAVA